MKKGLYLSTLFLLLMGMANNDAMAQDVPIVDYPYGNYMFWQCNRLGEFPYMDGIAFNSRPQEIRVDGQTVGYQIWAVPFNFPISGEQQACTIYGVAINFDIIPETHFRFDDLITNDFDVTLSIYKVTEGDSNLQLIKEHTEHIHQGQYPDIIIRMKSTMKEYLCLWEVYFDLPITIEGTFLVAVSTSIDRIVRIPCMHETCWKGYTAEILITKDEPRLCKWSMRDGCTGGRNLYETSYTHALTIPEITDSISNGEEFQGLCPILVPYGTTAAGEVRAEASAVRLTPNPATDKVTVQSPHGIRAVELTDMAGHTLLRQRCDDQPQSLTLDISALPQGIYAVKVETPQSTATEKLAVQ